MSSTGNTKLALAPISILLGGALMVFTNLGFAQQDRAQARDQAKDLGRQLIDEASQVHDRSNSSRTGTKAGCTVINGECVDNEELMGRGYDQSKVDRAMEVKGEKIESLKEFHDEGVKETTAKEGVMRDAWRTHEESEEARPKGMRIISQMDWTETNNAIDEGGKGDVPGIDPGVCTTTTTVIPGQNATQHIKEQHVCEIVTSPNDEGYEVCERERVPTPIQDTVTKQVEEYLGAPAGQNEEFCQRNTVIESSTVVDPMVKNGELDISQETGGLSCRRERWVEMLTGTEPKSKTATLGVNTETGGLSCSREVKPRIVGGLLPQEIRNRLPIDNQSGGNLCKRTAWPETTTVPGSETMTATLNVNSETGGLSCKRTIWPTGTSIVTGGSLIVNVEVDKQKQEYVCGRSIITDQGSGSEQGGKTGTISVNPGASGIACTRTIWPTAGSTPQSKSHDATLAIDTQTPAHFCTREVWPTAGTGSVHGQKDALLDLNNETPAELCRRWRTVSQGQAGTGTQEMDTHFTTSRFFRPEHWTVSIQGMVQPGTTITRVNVGMADPGEDDCNDVWVEDMPTPANNYTIGLAGSSSPGDPYGHPACERGGRGGQVWIQFQYTTPPGKTFGLQESGNCSATGTAHCPAQWSCERSAPTTIGGISVSAAEVSGLPLLYPGASNICVEGALKRTCGGAATTNNSISIAADLPPGTTAISDFTFNVQNPQPGVTVALEQTPAAANNWVARFKVTRINWSSNLAKPNIRMQWNTATGTVNVSTKDTGVCQGTATPNCPVTWQCTTNAPATINGITVTAAMAAQVAPLFPGAANTCVRGSLDRRCTSNSKVNTQVSIASRIDAGTTTISNLNFTVLNPNPNVEVKMIGTPTLDNNWVATFSVERKSYAAVYPPPNIRITWNVPGSGTTLSVVDEGNCADQGTAICPNRWSCTNPAPFTVNGISVTAAMAATQAPLFPGAPNNCVKGTLAPQCGGGSGPVHLNQWISIADALPVGTTTITNFNFSVTNPQQGIVVSLVDQPRIDNNWRATFRIQQSVFGPHVANPNINMTWTAHYDTHTGAIQETGNCNIPATANCPREWDCPKLAPDGNVTVDMALRLGPLYPGAPPTCVRAHNEKYCSGVAVTRTHVDISSRLQPGTTSISDFAMRVLNHQFGVRVSVEREPALSNNWVAIIKVERFVWNYNPVDPDVRLTWNGTSENNTLDVRDTGNCSDPGSSLCPTLWRCANAAPFTVNNISVTPAMASSVAPLFPGAPNTCVVGELNRVCSGSGGTSTTVSIAQKIPAGVTSIRNFGFVVTNQQAGVTVALTSAPTLANGWVATFNVVRLGSVSNPDRPQITMSWVMDQVNTSMSVKDVGNCSDTGTRSCPAEWKCEKPAPHVVNGIPVTAAMAAQVAPLFPGAANTCVVGSLDKTCNGSANSTTLMSIRHLLPPGTTAIRNFNFIVLNPQTGVAVSLLSRPTLANNWFARFIVSRTDFSTPKVDPEILATWDTEVSNVTLDVVDTGDCSDRGSEHCPTLWSCVANAPMTIDSIPITEAMARTVAPLFPQAQDTCLRGHLNRSCSGSGSVGTTVSIADLVPASANTIQNFAFVVNNPQTGVEVSLASAPTKANGWIATFNVVRTVWSRMPVPPSVTVTFDIDTSTPVFTVRETGNCNDPGSAACPTQWECKRQAPSDINGIPVSAAMVSGLPLLYPGANNTCLTGELSRVCSGNDGAITTISIADRIPPNTTDIQNFDWTVTNPQNGVTVTLTEAPTLANGWAAKFSVARDYQASGPNVVKPKVTLSWEISRIVHSAVIQETGDCSPRTSMQHALPVPNVQSSLLARASEMALSMVVPAAHAQAGGPPSPIITPGEPGGPVAPGNPANPGGPTNPSPTIPPSPGAGGACQVRWECTRSFPADVNGIPVTREMLDARGPLFDGDGPPPMCVEAKYHRTCQNGGASGVTEISIAAHLEPGTTSISNYSWTLIEPGAGVTVQERQIPALSNNWVARFEVIRMDFNVAPQSPKVRLQWDQPGPVSYEFPIQDTGDCSKEIDDGFCKTEWICEDRAPEPTRPVKVCSQVTTPWLDAPSTNGTASSTLDLKSHVPAGTRGILRFAFTAQTDHASCIVEVSPFPPAYNNMRVTVVTQSTQGRTCSPKIQFRWDNMCDDETWTPPPPPGGGGGWGPPHKDPWGPPVQVVSIDRNPTQVFLAGVKSVGNALLPAAIAAVHNPEIGEPGGGWWDGGDIINEPPLFPGDEPPSCMRARKIVNCSGTWTGTECFLNSEGVEVCHTVDPDTQPNNDCPIYEEDPECELIREECTDGAMSDSGWCYVKSRLYECKRGVDSQGTAPIIRETVSCPAAPVNECWDGSCSELQEDTTEVDMGEVSARFMIQQTMSNDFSNSWDPRNRLSHHDDSRNIEVDSNDAEGRSGLRFADAIYAMIGMGTAYAQDHPLVTGDLNPFQLPSHIDPDEIEDDDSPYGGVDNKVNIGHIRFFSGQRRDCMKALGGLLNCCKKTPPEDQAPTLWNFIKKNMAKSNNVRDQEETQDDDAGAFVKMLQNASHEDLQQMLTSRNETTKGGGQGADDDENMSFEQAYKAFMHHETTVVKPRMAWYCDNDEFELAVGKQTGTCTHLGSFCQTRVLGKCIIKKDRYCCFNSPVTRILREHMRDTGIAGMGTARRPQCDGITYDQMTRINADNISTGEIQGRMAQGQFNLDIMNFTNMSQADMESLLDGANSILGDLTRQNPSDRTQGYVDGTDHAGAYGSIMGNQAGYKTGEQPREASPGTVGLDRVEANTTRDRAFVVNVKRTGTQGAVRIRAWTEPGTAQQGVHYDPVDQVINWGDGEYGDKKILIKIRAVPVGTTYPRQYLTLRIEKISGDAELSGNASTKIWLEEEKGPSR